MASPNLPCLTEAEMRIYARENVEMKSCAPGCGRGPDYTLGPQVRELLHDMAIAFNYAIYKYVEDHDKYDETDGIDCFVDGSGRAIDALHHAFSPEFCVIELVVKGPLAVSSPIRQLREDFYREVGQDWASFALTEAMAQRVLRSLDEGKMVWDITVQWD